MVSNVQIKDDAGRHSFKENESKASEEKNIYKKKWKIAMQDFMKRYEKV